MARSDGGREGGKGTDLIDRQIDNVIASVSFP